MSAAATLAPDPFDGPCNDASPQLAREVEQFLVWEAELLDQRRLLEWLGLFADEVHYWMPTRSTLLADATSGSRSVARELSGPDELAFFDDDKLVLAARVMRVSQRTAWSENPPSRTRRIISNVVASAAADPSQLYARSNFLLYRSRHDHSQDLFAGQRRDLLVRVGDELKIASRKIILDSNVLVSPNLSVFF